MTTITPTADDYVLAADLLDRTLEILNETGVWCHEHAKNGDNNCTYQALQMALVEHLDHPAVSSWFIPGLGEVARLADDSRDGGAGYQQAYIGTLHAATPLQAALQHSLKVNVGTYLTPSLVDDVDRLDAMVWTTGANDQADEDTVLEAVKTAGRRARTLALREVETSAVADLIELI